MEDDDALGVEVRQPAVEVEQIAEALRLERYGHRVDGEVAPRQVAADAGVLDLGQRGRVRIGLRTSRGHVDTLAATAVAVGDHDGGPELLVRAHVTLEAGAQVLGEGDAVALDGDVDVEARLPQEEIADSAADEIHAAHADRHRLYLAEHIVEAELAEPSREIGGGRRGGLRRAGLTGDGAPRHRAQNVGRARSSDAAGSLTSGAHPISSCATTAATLSSAASSATTVTRVRHHRLDRRVAEAVRGGSFEIVEGDLAHQKAAVGDDDAADALPAAEQSGVVDRGPRQDVRRRRYGDRRAPGGPAATAAGTAAAMAAARSASEPSLTTADAAAACPPPPTGARAAATSRRPPRLRAVTKMRPSISTSRKYASQPVRSITRCATTLTPSTYTSSRSAETSTVRLLHGQLLGAVQARPRARAAAPA